MILSKKLIFSNFFKFSCHFFKLYRYNKYKALKNLIYNYINMKKIFSFFILTCILFSQVSAEVWWTITRSLTSTPTVYKTSEEFLKAEGNTCEVATDGCNTITIFNWTLWASTEMYCTDVYWDKWSYKWSCKKQKETALVWNDKDENGCIWSAWYSWNETKKECVRAWEEEPIMCTMQYDPVCGVDWVTYGNSCSAWKVKIAYTWECNSNSWNIEVSDWLTNDERLYNHIKATLSKKAQQKVWIVLKKYENRISKFSEGKKQEVNTSVIKALENEIFKITMKYPQDIALPESVNNAYLTITLLKMEIEKLNIK